MKTAFIITFLFFELGNAFSQEVYTLSGTITDSISKEKLAKASILLTKQDDTLYWRLNAGENGTFQIKIPRGSYNLEISHVGFTTLIKKIAFDADKTITVALSKSNTKLAGIAIVSEKKLITYSTDKITYNLSEGAVTASDNLYNIIIKVPGVSESGGSLFYQGKPLSILLDNKSNNLSGEDLKNHLSALLGTNVDKLEILLNPSSRYDAQGGAVFNIKLPRNKNYGLTQSITVGAGTGTHLRNTAGFTLNYRDSNINIYGGYDFNHQKQFFLLKAHLGFTINSTTIELVDDNTRTHNNHSVRLGIDYDLNKNTSIGLLFKGFQNYRKRFVINNSIYSPGPNLSDTVVEVITNSDALFKSPSLNLFLKTRLSSKGTDLVINADYFGYHKKWNEDIKAVYTDKSGASTASPDYLLNKSPADNSIRSITADLYHPVKNGNIEAGLKVTESKTDNNVLWQQLYNNSWKTDSAKTNHFIYKEVIYASYISILRNYKKLALQAGLRFEATSSNGISLTTNIVTPNKYRDVFPSVSIQYKVMKDQVLAVNYRRSIRRFGFDIINPFIITQGPYSYHQGNPYIKPSYFSSITFSWSYKNKLVIGTGFSAVTNPMSYGYRKYGNNNSSLGTFLNFSKGKLYNSNISYTAKMVSGKWTSINSLNFLHSELPDFDSQIQQHNNYVLNTVNNILLPKKVSMELSAFYNSPLLDGTVLRGTYYGVSLGFSKQVLKSKGSLKLSCTDVFNSQIFHNKTDGAGIMINAYWKPESRFANILFTYRFGNTNVKVNKNRNTGIEEERSRMGNN